MISHVFSRIRARPAELIAVLGALVIVVPSFILGPWLPFVDLVSFVGLDSYPPQLSYGPLHYYVFQFSYVGAYALSRFLEDLHVAVPSQILGIYWLQAGVCFAVVCLTLKHLVENAWLLCLGIAVGTLACWDGLFLAGASLSFYLAAACLTVATYLTMREAAGSAHSSGGLIALLCLAGLVFHPFALPFALLLGALRFVFVARHRLQTAGLVAACLLFGWIIVKDSPASESAGAAQVLGLFGFGARQFLDRLTGLFTQDSATVHFLFGFVPFWLGAYFIVLAVVHLAGFLTSPIVAILARESPWLRCLAALNTVVALLYLCSRDAPDTVVTQWPQRILTFYSPVTFLAGFAGPLWLARRYGRRAEPAASRPGNAAERRGYFLPSVAILALLVLVQIPILRLGDQVRRSFENVRSTILKTSVANAYVVVANVDAIWPYYLRCVPTLLFSDPGIVARNLIVHTEWHAAARHPTRLTEDWFDLGRARWAANFWMRDGVVNVRLDRSPAGLFPVATGTNARAAGSISGLALAQFNQGLMLADAGAYRDALEHFASAAALQPTFAKARNNMGAVLYSMGRNAEAIKQWEAAAALGDPDARSNLQLMRERSP